MQIVELLGASDIPAHFHDPSRINWTGKGGLLVLLRRLSYMIYPARLGNLCEEFGRSKAVMLLQQHDTGDLTQSSL